MWLKNFLKIFLNKERIEKISEMPIDKRVILSFVWISLLIKYESKNNWCFEEWLNFVQISERMNFLSVVKKDPGKYSITCWKNENK